jgi:hypothetical protein
MTGRIVPLDFASEILATQGHEVTPRWIQEIEVEHERPHEDAASIATLHRELARRAPDLFARQNGTFGVMRELTPHVARGPTPRQYAVVRSYLEAAIACHLRSGRGKEAIDAVEAARGIGDLGLHVNRADVEAVRRAMPLLRPEVLGELAQNGLRYSRDPYGIVAANDDSRNQPEAVIELADAIFKHRVPWTWSNLSYAARILGLGFARTTIERRLVPSAELEALRTDGSSVNVSLRYLQELVCAPTSPNLPAASWRRDPGDNMP